MKFKRAIAACLALMTVATTMTSCGKKTKTASAGEDDVLTVWMPLSAQAANTVADYGETPFAKKLQEETGVKIKFQHPPQGQEGEKFNIMMSMNELPDIIITNWVEYPGGPEKAITENKIIDLSKDIKTKAPDFYKCLDEHKDWMKLAKTDSGAIYNFPFIRGDQSLLVSQGLVLRKDWLDELGLQVPKTINDWETVLTAFKEKKNAIPLSMSMTAFANGAFSGAYGVTQGYYMDGNTVKYGPIEPNFKTFVQKMNEWYQKGLLDSDMASYDAKATDTKLLNNQLGATVGSIGSGIGKWMSMSKDEKFDLVAAPVPVQNEGDEIKFSFQCLPVVKFGAAITTSCKNVDAAYKLLNYGYSEKGSMLFNFGIEGESYNMENGYPKYTDLITKNSDGLSMTAALARYAQSCDMGAFVQDKRYMEQYGSLPQQQDALKLWSASDTSKTIVPYVFYNGQNTADIIKKSSVVDSYTNEMVIKFIMGIEPMDKFDDYVEELKNRGVEDVLAAKQDGYEKYLKR